MATTKRKDVLNEVLYRMGTIRKASGYATNLGRTVTRHRDTEAEPFDVEEVPALNVIDGQAFVVHNASDDEHSLEVDFIIHTSSRVTVDEVEEMMGDVVKCIEENENWGGHADGTALELHDIDTTQAGDTISAGRIKARIQYTTDKGKI